MSIVQALILGVVQGVTEFFPISSSGHLVIAQHLFGLKEPRIAFDVFLHCGTLLSIVLFFYKDICALFGQDRRILALLVLASIPTAVIGFLCKDAIERYFAMPKAVGAMLLVTGVVLIAASWWAARAATPSALTPVNTFVTGIAQGIAVIPGISRSGATISTALFLGIDKAVAFKFSFLLAIPAIVGASLLKARKIGAAMVGRGEALPYLVGFVAAAIVGYIALKCLSALVSNNQLYLFGIYCLIAGVGVIIAL